MIHRLWTTLRSRRGQLWTGFVVILLLLFWFSIPGRLFNDPLSTILLDRDRELMGARISADQQWRFPESDTVPEKFVEAITCYEDRWFFWHPGINPVALVRAAYLNLSRGRVVSGGSTLTMQVIRLSRKNQARTMAEKVRELFMAMRLELTRSKREILRLYASHAPFGGNVVGVEAAAWRYFGRDARQLSWAESATLAVLPNSPGLIYPGRNPSALVAKRNSLLTRLYTRGVIDSLTWTLALSERLPERPFPLPQMAPHLLNRVAAEGHRGARVVSTLDRHLQQRVNEVLATHSTQLRANEIWNGAVLVLEVNSGRVLAYAGNLPISSGSGKGGDVDIIRSPRSTGSILKPLLYAAMLNDGLILPNSLVPDIPMQIGGFIPENFNLTYDGAVPAKRALARSLNIPAVKMLQTYRYEQFYQLLKRLGMNTLNRPADHYGLALILGGAEATLWDMAGIYASMARSLNGYRPDNPRYRDRAVAPPLYLSGAGSTNNRPGIQQLPFDAASVWHTFEAMIEVARPDEELQWQRFSSSRKIAWKTGTSFGNRDAWSIGITPDHVVGVWVGNATGEGRPGLTGIGVAAPILFDVFNLLSPSGWFLPPDGNMTPVAVCTHSGYRASVICNPVDTLRVPLAGLKSETCPFHQMVHLDLTGRYQVNSDCETPERMQHLAWFVLPPAQEWYFRSRNPFYQVLPPLRPGCQAGNTIRNMEMIYPKNNSTIYIPTELGGKYGSAVFKVAHRDPGSLLYWHLDGGYMGRTSTLHQMSLSPPEGEHKLTLVDGHGERIQIAFKVLCK